MKDSQIDCEFFFSSYARTIYCDVTGRESRLPLRIRGDGIGPHVHFSLDTLDIGNVFLNSQHSYEVNINSPPPCLKRAKSHPINNC